MPRLRNDLTGAVMTVSDATAALLGGAWRDAEAAATPRKRTKATPAAKPDTEASE